MTKANMFKMITAMTKGMIYEYDVQHVSKSSIVEELFDDNNGNCVRIIGECLSINSGLWHIEYDEYNKSIWFLKTKHNSNGRAIGYTPVYWIDITDMKQFEICGELGYYIMQMKNDMKVI